MRYGAKLKDKDVRRVEALLPSVLLPGEQAEYATRINRVRGTLTYLVVTYGRVLALGGVDSRTVVHDIDGADVVDYRLSKTAMGLTLDVTTATGTFPFGTVVNDGDRDDVRTVLDWVRQLPPPTAARALVEQSRQAAADIAAAPEQALRAALATPGVVSGPPLKDKPFAAVLEQMHEGVPPWFVLNSGVAGQLVAFEDRLCIVKTGGMAGYMAGTTWGGRIATIYYRDITGIEYNAQLLSGVLEISTPSYQGTANKDFWRGSGASRNADANSPWTLSNTLPLTKPEYRAAAPQIARLRQKIAAAKNPTVVVQAPVAAPAAPSLAQQLADLAALHAQGALTAEEFAAAKAAVLGGATSG